MLAFSACGAKANTTNAPPMASLKPAGTGWFCDISNDIAPCFRDRERCRKRGVCLEEAEPIAWCVSYAENGGHIEEWCHRTSAACERKRHFMTQQPDRFGSVSNCGEWD
jgi:hypothetical protein